MGRMEERAEVEGGGRRVVRWREGRGRMEESGEVGKMEESAEVEGGWRRVLRWREDGGEC